MNPMNYADEIKQRLPAREVFEFYGFPVNRGGFACCPFHGEKTPSCKVYDDARGWHCFGCHAGGDVIDFARRYFGLDFPAAQAKLNDDFRLGLPIGQPLNRQERVEAERKAEERRRKAQERKGRADMLRAAYGEALTNYVALDIAIRKDAPQGPQTPLSECGDSWAFALRNIAGAAYDLAQAEGNLYGARLEKH